MCSAQKQQQQTATRGVFVKTRMPQGNRHAHVHIIPTLVAEAGGSKGRGGKGGCALVVVRSGEDHVTPGVAALLRGVEADGGFAPSSPLTTLRTRPMKSSKERSEIGRSWPICIDASVDEGRAVDVGGTPVPRSGG